MAAELPPLAEVDDLEKRLGRTLSDEEKVRAAGAIEDASALVRLEARRDFFGTSTVVPGAIRAVVLRVARREFSNPDSRTNRQIGPFSETYASGSGTAYLTDEERDIVTRFRPAGTSGLWTLSTTRGEHCGLSSASFIEDSFGLEPFLIGDDRDVFGC